MCMAIGLVIFTIFELTTIQAISPKSTTNESTKSLKSGNLPGVQNQILLKENTIALKKIISDHIMVKTKGVLGQNNLFTSTIHTYYIVY